MQYYSKENFNDYYSSYITSLENIKSDREEINKLLENETLKQAIELYEGLSEDDKRIFRRIIKPNDNIGEFWNYYMLAYEIYILEETNKEILDNITKDKGAFPFSVGGNHLFVYNKDTNEIVCIITLERINCSKFDHGELEFLKKVLVTNMNRDILCVNDSDIKFLSVLISKKLYKDASSSILLDAIKCADNIDTNKSVEDIYIANDISRVESLENKNEGKMQIISSVSSKNKKIAYSWCLSIKYILQIIKGHSVNELENRLKQLLEAEVISKKTYDLELTALARAYYNLIDEEYLKTSPFIKWQQDAKPRQFFTKNEAVNQKILDMRKR